MTNDYVATDQEIGAFVRKHMGIYRFLVSTSAGRFESNVGRVALDGSIRILPDPIRVATHEEIAGALTCGQGACTGKAVALHPQEGFADHWHGVGRCKNHAALCDLWLIAPGDSKKSECTQGCR
jgi:hypothetical protein